MAQFANITSADDWSGDITCGIISTGDILIHLDTSDGVFLRISIKEAKDLRVLLADKIQEALEDLKESLEDLNCPEDK